MGLCVTSCQLILISKVLADAHGWWICQLVYHYHSTVSISNAGLVYIQDVKLVNTVHADGLAPNGARPSAGTVMTMESVKFVSLANNDLWYIYLLMRSNTIYQWDPTKFYSTSSKNTCPDNNDFWGESSWPTSILALEVIHKQTNCSKIIRDIYRALVRWACHTQTTIASHFWPLCMHNYLLCHYIGLVITT